jgi:hypothetical protein
MLHCTMNPALPPPLLLDLEDVLGSLVCARREDDLGRLALLTYWEVRRWARTAHRDALAARAADLVLNHPHPSRGAFLEIVDTVIDELNRILAETH